MYSTKEKGITLIALIVTIIVLLILAGVSLKLVAGSDGILGKAEKAVNQYQMGEEKEILGLSYSSVYMKDVLGETGITPELLQTEIEKNGKKATVNARESNKKVLIVVFEKTKNVYEINIDTGEIKSLGQYTGDHSSEDLTEGDIKFSSTPGAGEYTNDKVETTISIGEGIDTTNLYLEYAIEDPLVESNWNVYTEKITSTKNQTIYARIKDKITGETKCQASTNIGNIDKEPPTGTLTIKNKTTSKVTLEVRASDNPSGSSQIAVSGIKGYYFSKDNGATYTELTTETSYTFEGLTQNEEYKFKVKIEDNVGNTREVVTAGNTELINGTITFGAATWSGTTATVAITGEQEGCVLKYYAGATIPDLSKETVAGWTTIESGKTVTTTSNTYIVAVLWDETNYGAKWATEKILRPGTISYNANGGTGGPSSQTVSHTQTATVNFTTLPTRKGYTFKGWSTDKNATSATYTSSGTKSFTMGTSDVTLYAVWSVNSYTIYFANNGGSGGPTSMQRTYGQAVTFPNEVPTRKGYTFKGWSYYGGGNQSEAIKDITNGYYEAGQTVEPAEGNLCLVQNYDATYIAGWEANTYTIYFANNGGSGGPTSMQRTYGQAVTFPDEVPIKTGYTFKGWSYYAGGNQSEAIKDITNGYYEAGQTVEPAEDNLCLVQNYDATYIAGWEANTYILTIDPNGGYITHPGSNDEVTIPFTTTFTYGSEKQLFCETGYWTEVDSLKWVGTGRDASLDGYYVPYKPGYTFKEWRVGNGTIISEKFSNKEGNFWDYYFSCDYAGNVRIEAQWTEN